MRKFTFIATVIALLANAMWVAESHAQWPQTTFNDMRFSLEVGAKAYDRPGSKLGLPLITDSVTNDTLFGSDQATDLGSAGGAEVKFNFESRHGQEYEIRTIIADWEQLETIEGANLQSPFFPRGAPAPTSVDYGYSADYFSIELMARRAIRPGVTVMAGPRYVSTKDLIRLAGSVLVNPGDGTNTVLVTETQTIEATNGLIGLQCGVEFNVPITPAVYINGFGRFGGYMNPTEVHTGTFNDFSGVSTSGTQSKSTGSFLGEVGGRLYCDLIPNHLATYVGWEGTWIDGIALAPAQVLTVGDTSVQTANTPFFNAVTFGVRMTY